MIKIADFIFKEKDIHYIYIYEEDADSDPLKLRINHSVRVHMAIGEVVVFLGAYEDCEQILESLLK